MDMVTNKYDTPCSLIILHFFQSCDTVIMGRKSLDDCLRDDSGYQEKQFLVASHADKLDYEMFVLSKDILTKLRVLSTWVMKGDYLVSLVWLSLFKNA